MNGWRLTTQRLNKILDEIPSLSIGLLGDLFLDRYLEIDANRTETSIETGIDAYQVVGVRNVPGALGTVINNLAAIGVSRLVPVTVIGNDGHGYDLLRAMAGLPCDTAGVIRRDDRLTPTYTKPMLRQADGTSGELNRLDVRTRASLTPDAAEAVADHLRSVFDTVDGWIVLDQINETQHGIVNTRVRDCLKRLSQSHSEKLIFIDSRCSLSEFTHGILKGNQAEIAAAGGDNDIDRAASNLAAHTGQAVFATLGEKGMLIAHPDGRIESVSNVPVGGPIDIVGAGDSATAAIVTAILSGASLREAAEFANIVASITIQQIGTTGTASPNQVFAVAKSMANE